MIRLTHAAVLILATSLAVPSAVAAETEVERKPPASQQREPSSTSSSTAPVTFGTCDVDSSHSWLM